MNEYQEGFDAHDDGFLLSENPYVEDTVEAENWADGWHEANWGGQSD